jgi:hypothetical protein
MKTSIENAADRGAADSYYRRPAQPHVRIEGVNVAVLPDSAEGRAYLDAYYANERLHDFKDWGEPEVYFSTEGGEQYDDD